MRQGDNEREREKKERDGHARARTLTPPRERREKDKSGRVRGGGRGRDEKSGDEERWKSNKEPRGRVGRVFKGKKSETTAREGAHCRARVYVCKTKEPSLSLSLATLFFRRNYIYCTPPRRRRQGSGI